jgi:hypothetical protein
VSDVVTEPAVDAVPEIDAGVIEEARARQRRRRAALAAVAVIGAGIAAMGVIASGGGGGGGRSLGSHGAGAAPGAPASAQHSVVGARLFSAGNVFSLFNAATNLFPGPSVLGPDGTVWGAQQENAGESDPYVIFGRTATGHSFRPHATISSLGSLPSIAATSGVATFVSYGSVSPRSRVEVLRSLRCTPRGCGARQLIARWREVPGRRPVDLTGYPPQPATIISRGTTVVVFTEGLAARVMWAQTSGGRFGPAHSFGVTGQNEPVLVAEPGGRVLAAWLDGATQPWVDWSEWTPGYGFGTVHQLHGAEGPAAANLAAAPDGSEVALAWIQGDNGIPGQDTDPVWVARRHGTGAFTAPIRVFRGSAGMLSFAGADGVLALAFSATPSAGDWYADDAHGALVERSVQGGPFSPPLDLDPKAGPNPTVTVAGNGDVLATWVTKGPNSQAILAVAPPSGPFGRRHGLGTDTEEYGPRAGANATRALITWQDQGTTEGVFATN